MPTSLNDESILRAFDLDRLQTLNFGIHGGLAEVAIYCNLLGGFEVGKPEQAVEDIIVNMCLELEYSTGHQ